MRLTLRVLVLASALLVSGGGLLLVFSGDQAGRRHGGRFVSAHALEDEVDAPSELQAVSKEDGIAPRVERASDGTIAGRALIEVTGAVMDHFLHPLEAVAPAAGIHVWADHVFSTTGAGSSTDESGAFCIVLDDPGTRPLRLRIWSEDSSTMRVGLLAVSLDAGESRRGGLRLDRFAHGDLVGTTVDPSGAAIPHVRLMLELGGIEVREALSDGFGRFRIPDARGPNLLNADLAGYVLLEARPAVPLPAGGWEPMQVVLASTADLTVTVLDGEGRGVPGLEVRATVSPAERFGAPLGVWDPSARCSPSALTNDEGRAELKDVPAEQKLAVSVRGADLALESERWQDDVLLVGEPRFRGQAIVLERGKTGAAVLRTGAVLRLRGRVLQPNGSSAPYAEICFTPFGHLKDPLPVEALREAHADQSGEFDMAIRAAGPIRRALIMARDSETGSASAWHPLELGDEDHDRSHLVLVLEGPLSIRGRIVDALEEPVRAVVRAYPAERTGSDIGPATVVHMGRTQSDGHFVLEGLVAGPYDIHVLPMSRWSEVRLSGVAAGTEDVFVRLEEKRPVRVQVQIDSSLAELTERVLLVGRLHPWGDLPEEARPLPSSFEQHEPRGWPEMAVDMLSGSHGYTDEFGSVDFTYHQATDQPMEAELDEGWYWIGARAKDENRRLCFPAGTGLVSLTAGEYSIRFILLPTAPLEGMVKRAQQAPELLLAIGQQGELLHIDGRRGRMTNLVELGADGGFLLPEVPYGRYELRIGTREELLSGSYRHAEPVLIGPNAEVRNIVLRD